MAPSIQAVSRPADNKYFKGYAFVNLVLPYCGGAGVKLQGQPDQRSIGEARLNELEAVTSAGLHNNDPHFSIRIKIRNDFYNSASVAFSPDENGSYPTLEFTSLASKQKATLMDGHHRKALLKRKLGSKLNLLKKMWQLSKDGSPEERKEMRPDYDRLRESLMSEGVWLAQIHSEGMRFCWHWMQFTLFLK